jgi:3-hydroxypropanoate dehydrogenase
VTGTAGGGPRVAEGSPAAAAAELARNLSALGPEALDRLFREARTYRTWQDRPVEDDLLHQLYELLKWGPTSANCTPARFFFLKSWAAKERLRPVLMPGNVKKTMAAPVTVIIAHDLEFFERLPELYPQEDARAWFAGRAKLIEETAFRNASLQGAYLIMAARALGLDCGPMSGFSKKALDAEFFPDSSLRSNFLCNLGYGDPAGLSPRLPRLAFEAACRIL